MSNVCKRAILGVAKCLAVLAIISMGCAGPNPNPGERSTDIAWTSGRYQEAFQKVQLHAERGEPWAQLRIGIFYENGWGVEQNAQQAAEWYRKASLQKATGEWAEGVMLGAFGQPGYFNQNSDARIAEFNLAQLLYKGKGIDKNLIQAYVHVAHVIKDAAGKAIFFCCEFSNSRYFTPTQFAELRDKIKAEMTQEQLSEAERLLSTVGDTAIQSTP